MSSEKMTLEQAKMQLQSFFGERVLTFSVRNSDSGEWVARCNEIPAILTGGNDEDIAIMDRLMRDAILTAAGVDPEYGPHLLKLVDYAPKEIIHQMAPSKTPFVFGADREAEYAISA
jgi:hypothetical protein